MTVTFTKDLETGNIAIDTQHKALIEAINKLMDACSKGQGRAQVKQTAAFLLDYTQKHFADEEVLQRKFNYPDFASHKRYHEGFVQVVKDLVNELQTKDPDVVIVGKINSAVMGWLVNHIKREDVRVAAHIKAQSASGAVR